MKTKPVPEKSAAQDKPVQPKSGERLSVCRNAPHAEMARNENKDEPCDDGREG
jgi:hypothetical protein